MFELLFASLSRLRGQEASEEEEYSDFSQVNRCLARYSPHATTHNQPTKRASIEPPRPIRVSFCRAGILAFFNSRAPV